MFLRSDSERARVIFLEESLQMGHKEQDEAESEMEWVLGIWWKISGSGDESFAWGSHEFSIGVEELLKSIIAYDGSD